MNYVSQENLDNIVRRSRIYKVGKCANRRRKINNRCKYSKT